MQTSLGLDIGSSSVIAGILCGKQVLRESPRVFFRSSCDGPKVEVDPDDLLRAVARAIRHLGAQARKVDWINFAVMAPAWIAMDDAGTPLTPIVTHQDRRSIPQSEEIERCLGKARHLKLCGNRPFPGGISSTTWAWFLENEPERLRNARLVGHLNTFLHRRLTGARVIDPSNASFTGLFDTIGAGAWNEELIGNLGIDRDLLPQVREANEICGAIQPSAARAIGLREGTPVLAGIMDGSAGMIFAGAEHGRLFNVVGSTDVLALCTTTPRPGERLLTRSLGIGKKKWLSVGTIAAAASSIYWAHGKFFSEMRIEDFQKLTRRLAGEGAGAAGGVVFDPFLAGERANIRQRSGAFHNLTLATTRNNLLSAILEALIAASAARIPLLEKTGTRPLPDAFISGGADRLDRILRRDWPGQWRFRETTDATMRGLGKIQPI